MKILNRVRCFVEQYLVDCRDITRASTSMLGFALVVVIELLTVLGQWFIEVEGFAFAVAALLVFALITTL